MEKYGIVIDLSRDDRLTDQAKALLKNHYLAEGETSPQEAFARAAVAYCEGDIDLAQRIYEYVSKGWFMYSSPILSNAPAPGMPHKALPISCFLSYVDDTVEGIVEHHKETAWLSVKGGGVGGHWGSIRAISEKSPGVIPWLKVTDSQMTSFKQGKTRKGSYAAYLDVSHPDIMEFVAFKKPTGGDSNRKCFNLFNAANVTDKFMNAVKNDDNWDLICPTTNEVKETIKARELWEAILENRYRTGSPYINFIDTANRALPDFQGSQGLTIKGSNLCNEIHLVTDKDRTAVCCLSSVNLEKSDEWLMEGKLIPDLVEFLDNVLTAFIREAPDVLHKAVYSAERERSIGIGAMGFHGLLMKNHLAWDSPEAYNLNRELFREMSLQAKAATRKLADIKGEAPDAVGYNVRNSHLFAIAPNANSSILCDCTASIEPFKANVFVHRTRVGAHVSRNKYLAEFLEKIGKNTEETWASIMDQEGSVQHLDFLDDHAKEVFKTSFEIDQHAVVEQAAVRQEFICQGQSVNTFFNFGADRTYVNSVHRLAWSQGLKGLYYLRTTAGKTGDKVNRKVERHALQEDLSNVVYGKDDCPYCHSAMTLLKEYNIEAEFVNITELGKTAAEVTGKDVNTVPQIYLNGEYIGGYADLKIKLSGMSDLPIEMVTPLNPDEPDCVACEG